MNASLWAFVTQRLWMARTRKSLFCEQRYVTRGYLQVSKMWLKWRFYSTQKNTITSYYSSETSVNTILPLARHLLIFDVNFRKTRKRKSVLKYNNNNQINQTISNAKQNWEVSIKLSRKIFFRRRRIYQIFRASFS